LGGEISILSQNFPKPPSILFHPLESSISQTSPTGEFKKTLKPTNQIAKTLVHHKT
jgi:hypothetical protein